MLAPSKIPLHWLDDDVRDVHRAAARLRIPEFAFFHLAYRRWFGRAARDPLIEPHFMAYLYDRRVPLWVRHLARDVLARAGSGAELCTEFGVRPVLPPPANGPSERLRGLLLAAFYVACFALFTYHAL